MIFFKMLKHSKREQKRAKELEAELAKKRLENKKKQCKKGDINNEARFKNLKE